MNMASATPDMVIHTSRREGSWYAASPVFLRIIPDSPQLIHHQGTKTPRKPYFLEHVTKPQNKGNFYPQDAKSAKKGKKQSGFKSEF
jgi:hypothetical protein